MEVNHVLILFTQHPWETSRKLGPSWWWGWITLRQSVLNTTLCDKVCKWLVTGRWYSPVSSTTKTDRHNITEILLKVALNTINQTIKENSLYSWIIYFKSDWLQYIFILGIICTYITFYWIRNYFTLLRYFIWIVNEKIRFYISSYHFLWPTHH